MTKKIALTAALVAAGFAGTAVADSHPTVTLGGHLDTYYGFVSEKDQFRYSNPGDTGSSKRRDHALANEAKVTVRADGKLEHMAHTKYGAMIKLNADTSDDHYGDSYNAQQTMAYFEGPFGRLEAGSYTGASHALHVSATQIGRGHSGVDAGGIDSDWWEWINPKEGGNEPLASEFMLLPQLYTNNIALVGVKNVNSSKLTYFTPGYYGFKAGVTYIPDLESYGTVHNAMQDVYKYSSNTGGVYRDIFEGGIHYAGKMSGLGVKAALVGQTGDSKLYDGTEFHRLRAWEAGASVQYMHWTLAGAYGNLGKSGQAVTSTGTDSKYWNVGVAYEHGPMGVSLTYASTKARFDIHNIADEKTRVHTVALGADWKLAKGVKLYTDMLHFTTKEVIGAETANRGNVIRVGSLLNF